MVVVRCLLFFQLTYAFSTETMYLDCASVFYYATLTFAVRLP